MVIAVADEFAVEHTEHAAAILAEPLGAAEKLRAYVTARVERWAAFGDATPQAGELAHAVMRLRPERVGDFARTFQETVARILADGHASGELVVPDPAVATEVFYCAMTVFFPIPGGAIPRLHPAERLTEVPGPKWIPLS